MIETHPFGSFVPKNAWYLILGSFPGRQKYDWFYGNPRNHFWQILQKIYRTKLASRKDKQRLLGKLGIAITDIIYKCRRSRQMNSDLNLVSIVYNTSAIKKILQENKIKKIFFTSRFVEKKFKSIFHPLIEMYPNIKTVTLPSPSPRFAKMSFEQKAKEYKRLLPRLV